MQATVILRVKTKPDNINEFKEFIAKCLPETRLCKGCINIDIYEECSQNGYFVFYENWDSFASYEAYLSYRTEQGVMDKLSAFLSAPPEIVYYNRVDI
jgi:quinol monooxygenase YgiN